MTHDNPSMDGFFAVADWEHHRQAWMAWPTDPDEVPVSLLEAQVCLAEIARVVSRFERVSIIAEPEHAAEAKIAVGPDIDVVPGPVAHAAIRDLGPTFLMQEDGTVKGVAWQFNGWGGRRIVHGADREFSEAVLRATGHPGYHGPLVLEGGAVISDGLGTVIASEQNLLAANRNPLVSRRDVERILMDFYGAAKIIWLGDGISGLIGGGHVSRFARFVRPGVIALHLPEDPEGGHVPSQAVAGSKPARAYSRRLRQCGGHQSRSRQARRTWHGLRREWRAHKTGRYAYPSGNVHGRTRRAPAERLLRRLLTVTPA